MIPSMVHEEYFRKACGIRRYAYNWGLHEWKNEYTEGKKPNWMTLKKKLNSIKKSVCPWMYEVTKCAPEGALADLGTAWANYFRDLKKTGRKSKKPVFKKKGKCQDKFYISNDQFTIDGKMVDLPHIGKVPLREKLRFTGRIMGATISRMADRWFISIQVETDVSHLKQNNKNCVGIDLGIETDLTLSTGVKLKGPAALKKRLKKLGRLNRWLHRKIKGSASRKKAALKVARQHRKIRNIRTDFIHKVTTRITRKFGIVCLEDLNTSGMLKNHKLARSISDVSFQEVKRQLEYKTELRGGKTLFVERFFPSSKQCRKCSKVTDHLTLKDRTFHCSNHECLHTEDRDIHAARNIRKQITLGRREKYADGHPTSMATRSRKRFGSRKSGGLKSEKCINTQGDSQA
jgi:putative transposase